MKHILKRTASWLLAAALVLTSFYLPGGKVKQASAAGSTDTIEAAQAATATGLNLAKSDFAAGRNVTVQINKDSVTKMQDYIYAQLDKGSANKTTLTFSFIDDIDLKNYVNPGTNTNVWEPIYAENDDYSDEAGESIKTRTGFSPAKHAGLKLKLESAKKDNTHADITNLTVSDKTSYGDPLSSSVAASYGFFGKISGYDEVSVDGIDFINASVSSSKYYADTGILAEKIDASKVSISNSAVTDSKIDSSLVEEISGTNTGIDISNITFTNDKSTGRALLADILQSSGSINLSNISVKRSSVTDPGTDAPRRKALIVADLKPTIKSKIENISSDSESSVLVSSNVKRDITWAQGVGGLFGEVANASLENVTNGASVTAEGYGFHTGGVAGLMRNVTLNSVSNSGKVFTGTGKPSGQFVGGVAGTIEGTSSVTDSENTGDITGGTSVGGLFGQVSGNTEIKNSKKTVFEDGSSHNVDLTNQNSGTVTGSDGGTDIGGIAGTLEKGSSIAGADNTGDVAAGGCSNVGGIVGNNSGTVTGSSTDSNVNVDGDQSVGGNVGYNQADGTVSGDASGASVYGNKYVGGNVGKNDGKVEDSRNTGSITGNGNSSEDVGGNVGWNTEKADTSDSVNSGNVKGGKNVGGNVGLNDGTATNNKNSGDITGKDNVGGNVGDNSKTGTVTNPENSGDVSGTGDNVGGNVGLNDGTVSGTSTNTGDVKGDEGVGGNIGNNTGKADDLVTSKDSEVTGNKDTGDNVGKNTGTVGSEKTEDFKPAEDPDKSGSASGDATKGGSDQQASGDATKGGSDQSGSDQGNAGTGNNPSVNPTDAGSDSSKGGSSQQGSGTDAGKGGQSTNPADAGSQSDSDQGTPTAGTSGKTGNQTGADSGTISNGGTGTTNASGSTTNTTNNYYSTTENSELHGWEYTSSDATAALNTVELTVDPANSGSINFVTFSGDRKTITVNAVPAQGYSFVSWTVDGVVLKDGADNFNFDSSVVKSVKATFAPSAKVGDMFTVDNYVYQIKTLPNPAASADGTVKVLRNTSNKITSIVVADTVNYLSRTYRVNEIAPKAFTKYTSATSAVIGKFVVTVGSSAFKGDSKLKTVKFNSTELKTIGSSAFRDCKKLKSVSVKSGKLTRIGSSAFRNDKALKTVTIKSKKLKTISGSAFRNATKLKKVTLKSTKLKTISSKAFYGDKKLKTVSIKSSKLKKIGSRAFYKTKVKAFKSVPKKKKAKYAALLAKAKK